MSLNIAGISISDIVSGNTYTWLSTNKQWTQLTLDGVSSSVANPTLTIGGAIAVQVTALTENPPSTPTDMHMQLWINDNQGNNVDEGQEDYTTDELAVIYNDYGIMPDSPAVQMSIVTWVDGGVLQNPALTWTCTGINQSVAPIAAIEWVAVQGNEIYPPAPATAAEPEGSSVQIQVQVMNQGSPGLCYCDVVDQNSNQIITAAVNISSGSAYTFSGSFTMPNANVTLSIMVGHEMGLSDQTLNIAVTPTSTKTSTPLSTTEKVIIVGGVAGAALIIAGVAAAASSKKK